jgi:DNA-binding NtrC family response regulator
VSQEQTAGKFRCILLVEDSVIIAMDIEETLSDHGVGQIALAFDCEEALAMLDERTDIDAALIDFYTRSERCIPVIDALIARGIPFGLVTGFGDPLNVVGRWPNVPVLHKPFIREDVVKMLDRLG